MINFKNGAIFSGIKFLKESNFSGTIFKKYVDFSESFFKEKPIFECAPYSETYKAKFSHEAEPEDYNFEVSSDSPYKIETEKHRSPDGTITTIPKGCSVFNPSLTKVSISGDNIIGISVKGVPANGAKQIQEKLDMSLRP